MKAHFGIVQTTEAVFVNYWTGSKREFQANSALSAAQEQAKFILIS